MPRSAVRFAQSKLHAMADSWRKTHSTSLSSLQMLTFGCTESNINHREYKFFGICSDFRQAVDAAQYATAGRPIVCNIFKWLALHSMRGQDVTFCWVPAYVGIKGNGEAGEVAKAATRSNYVPRLTLPQRDFLPKIPAWLLEQTPEIKIGNAPKWTLALLPRIAQVGDGIGSLSNRPLLFALVFFER